MSSERETIMEKIFKALDTCHSSMEEQSSNITDIIEKSHNILLQIESSHATSESTAVSAKNRYVYAKEAEKTLAKILEFLPILFEGPNLSTENQVTFEEYLKHNKQYMEMLRSTVRKLLVVGDMVAQMKTLLTETANESKDSDM